ncbi:hypothetical protein Patl1_09145 [Pistacia atlantica]|uniref:Uncharacterized protein n=1 Tax=Pistacia atlantica TaxID=434234 RepID=A0ACC1AFF3_9ROSI|nr:hypothetical protein Patl1_09145 [Pistacia atlantica]
MEASLLRLKVAVLLLFLIHCVQAQQVLLNSTVERSALLDLRSSLGLRSRDWPLKAEPCKFWKGVQCENGHVIGINISGFKRTRIGRLNPRFSVDSLANLTQLRSFNASGFSLPGSIPDWFGSRFPALQVLDLRSCSVSGSIPGSLGNLSSVNLVYLSGNSLAGRLPATLGQLKELSGFIPDDLRNLDKLVELDLSKNLLSGSLPTKLRALRSLEKLFVDRNGLVGHLSGDMFSGLDQLQVVDLSGNKFDGELPVALLSMHSLQLLDLADNNFTGVFPSLNSDVQGLLSRRNVTLDRNCFQDVANQRSPGDCILFYTKRGLSFDNFGVPGLTQPPLSKQGKEQCDQGTANQRGTANVGPVPEGDSPLPPKDPNIVSGVGDSFTYEQLLRASGSFSAANLIKHGHSGDLFKGTLEGGTTVVVKKVSLHSFKKESYIMELDLFSKVSHARLVPLLGQCLEHETDKLLVYKYMVCGDLASSLYRITGLEDDSLKSLDWITRLKIAIGAAEGLSYLHHECNPPLVHRDVQASSILLDDKFEVRLGSLSEVRAQEGDSHQNVITRLLRKHIIVQLCVNGRKKLQGNLSILLCIGSSTATCAYDVYCFGKVLLELVTGKLGISKSDDATTREWIGTYTTIHQSCLNPKPSKRPPMKYILKALENPFKVVREESFSSARLRTTSSRRSWSTAFFGSWRQSSSESAIVPGHTNREGISGLKQSGRIGSHGSGGIEHSSSNKRLSNEIFPEPVDMQDMERQDEH